MAKWKNLKKINFTFVVVVGTVVAGSAMTKETTFDPVLTQYLSTDCTYVVLMSQSTSVWVI